MNVISVSGKAENLQSDDRVVSLQHSNKLLLNRPNKIMPTVAAVLHLRHRKLLPHEGLHMEVLHNLYINYKRLTNRSHRVEGASKWKPMG